MSVLQRWDRTKELRLSTEECINTILLVVSADNRILVMYLFGSQVYIAIFTLEEFSWREYYFLYGEISKRLHSDRIDTLYGLIKQSRF
jgi:hypothetical protein